MHVKKPRGRNLLKLRQLFKARPKMIQRSCNQISRILAQQKLRLFERCSNPKKIVSQSQRMIADADEIFDRLETIDSDKDPNYLAKSYFRLFKWSLVRDLFCNLVMLTSFVMLTQLTRDTIKEL